MRCPEIHRISVSSFLAIILFCVLIYFEHSNQIAAIATIKTITVGKHPIDIAVNPVMNFLYVSNYQSHSISVIDGSTKVVVDNIQVGKYPSDIIVNANTNSVYVANKVPHDGPGYSAGSQISVIDSSTNKLMWNFSGVGLELLNPNSSKIYVKSTSNLIDILNSSTFTKIGTLNISNVTDSALDDKTDTIYFIDKLSNLYTVSGSRNTIVNKTAFEGYSLTGIDVNSLNEEIYITATTGKSKPNSGGISLPMGVLFILDARTDKISTVLRIISPSDIIVNPKTDEIYITNSFSGEVYLIDAKSATVINGSIPVGNFPQKLAWNPVDQSIYVVNSLSNTVSVISKSLSNKIN